MKQILLITLSLICCCQTSSCQEKKVQVSDCTIDGKKVFNIDTILKYQLLELENENIKENFEILIQQKTDLLLKAKTNKELLFPFSSVDSAVYIEYEDVDDKRMNWQLEEREIRNVIILCDQKTDAMIDLVNDPNNFDYGECGTPIPQSQNIILSAGCSSRRNDFCL